MSVFSFLVFTVLELTFVDLRVSGGDSYKCRPWPVEGMSNPIYFMGCYIKSTFDLTWAEARDLCSNNGGHLFVPDKEYEPTIFSRQFDCAFMGLIWDSVVGWKWIDGSLPTFFSWDRSVVQPVNASLLDCAAICQRPHPENSSWLVLYSWTLRPCESKLEFICEYDPTPIEPKRPNIRPLPSPQKPRQVGFRIESFTRVTANPDIETTAFSSTMCARECQKRLTPCVVLNYNKATKACSGFTSMEVIGEQQREAKDWITLIAIFY